jgi:hypothetical protein
MDQDQEPHAADRRVSPTLNLRARLRGRGTAALRPMVLIAVVIAVLSAGYLIGASGTGGQQPADTLRDQSLQSTAMGLPAGLTGSGAGVGALPASSAAPLVPAAPNEFAPVADTSLIVKTGQMTLQVASLDSAVSQAQTQVTGMGGYVASSTRSGSADNASATLTYRLPVAHWDEALSDLRKLASKVVSEQTDSSDVTSQAIDLDARLSNLKTTESALQAIMARATAIPDVLAVEQQLSTTQGQIEQLTAQRNHLGDQAAMSTVAVTFTLPNETVTTQTAQGWQLGGQIDQAAAQLVRIGQGLVTIVVWAVIVGLPVLLALLILFVAWRLSRRLMGRGHRPDAAPTQA